MEKIMEPFGLRLKELRRRRNITQVEMAELLGCTDRHYQKIEYGYVNVPSLTLIKLADFFGVTTDYLLRPQTQQQTPPEDQPPRSGHAPAGQDTISRLGYLAKTKGYLLGWVLIAWGVLDLVTLALMGLGVLNFMFW